MSHEQPNIGSEKLPSEEVKKLIKKYPQVKLDEGNQHFMVEHTDENGNWRSTDMIPTWKEIPREKGEAVPIEKEIRDALGLPEETVKEKKEAA
ncbi:hypothetical protein HYT01_03260 [Candidatus Giovannonibacteria bacterium]|nr:hypothetical protein [Candidatus Giovannonibacteria bacterium]